MLSNPRERRRAVKARQVQVEEDNVEGKLIGQADGLLAVAGVHHLGTSALQYRPDIVALRGRGVRQQHPHALQSSSPIGVSDNLDGIHCGRIDTEPEGRTDAKFAGNPDLAAHDLDQGLADRQPQTCAAVPTGGGGVDLREPAEQLAALISVQAGTGVFDLDAQLLPRADIAHLQSHHASVGELDGVANQIQQHLAQAIRINRNHLRQAWIALQLQPQRLGLGLRSEHRQGVLYEGGHVDSTRREDHLARLQLGEVQDIVDDGQQRRTRTLDPPDLKRCDFREVSPRRQQP